VGSRCWPMRTLLDSAWIDGIYDDVVWILIDTGMASQSRLGAARLLCVSP